MELQKPIIIFGTGRSGTTIFHKIFSEHPHAAWLSGLCHRFPDKPQLNRRMLQGIDYPWLDNFILSFVGPGECYPFWELSSPGFTNPFRDLSKEDVLPTTKEKLHNAFSEILTKKRERLLLKITGWPRLGFLHEIFEDAKFIHIVRDGRAVANSLINVPFWRGWEGPQNWRWGELGTKHQNEWEEHDRSFIALAGIQWNICINAFQQTKHFIPEKNLLEIKYEDLCSEPIEILRSTMEFCELETLPSFEKAFRKKYSLKNTNFKWKKELTAHQQKIIESVTREFLELYGYE